MGQNTYHANYPLTHLDFLPTSSSICMLLDNPAISAIVMTKFLFSFSPNGLIRKMDTPKVYCLEIIYHISWHTNLYIKNLVNVVF